LFKYTSTLERKLHSANQFIGAEAANNLMASRSKQGVYSQNVKQSEKSLKYKSHAQVGVWSVNDIDMDQYQSL